MKKMQSKSFIGFLFVSLVKLSCVKLIFAVVDIKDLLPVDIIPGTELFTGLFYTISMKSFPQGYITWIDTKKGLYNIKVELDPKTLPDYGPRKKYEIDSQWYITATDDVNKFTLTNRRKPMGLLTYTGSQVGSGYHAAIFDNLEDRLKMLPGGAWRNYALWTFRSDKNDKEYYKLENVGMKGAQLSWSYSKHNQYSYFIQLAKYEAEDDSKFLFKPSEIKLSARISDFVFKETPQDVFNRAKNQKRRLVSKHRYPNNSPANITQTLNENVVTKELITFSFTESMSMMYSTTIEVDFIVARGRSTFKFQGSFDATQAKTKETTKTTILKTEIKVPPYTDVEASIYNVWANNFVLPFKAQMLVTGVTQRIVAARPNEVQVGCVPGDVVDIYLKGCGEHMQIIKRIGTGILVSVSGEIKGNIEIQTTVSTKEVKKISRVHKYQ